ncbi:AAA family ATPase [Myxococcus landrumensis]|uniref:AAA family ATPase n=1 Tax=Myxococcus landrumensis TaxID=2813577 RepID=A0ABX7N0E1_9BACT|nr:ATP-binding protein [Myxococcus landrumus]QSQ12179.1 AAA family ATPase [Myxococcus landrumus]
MYLKKVVLENIRSMAELEWEPPSLPGWHVVIGDNGAGKSSFLRAISLAMVGRDAAMALRQDWGEWLRVGTPSGSIQLSLSGDSRWDQVAGSASSDVPADLRLQRAGSGTQLVPGAASMVAAPGLWGLGPGWFSAAYGAFRRFTGGDAEQETLFSSQPRLARHLSMFDASVSLRASLEWLKLLEFKRLEKSPEGGLVEPLKAFINQPDFLPHQTQLDSISSRGVRFVDGQGSEVSVENLGDGFQSLLSLAFELIRQLASTYGAKHLFAPGDTTTLQTPGVVLIDEVEAHLHPTWQRRVGFWFRKHFPNIQFIVTTHSPLICQAAAEGSIFWLPRPGSDEPSSMVTGIARERLLYGSVVDAYGTGAFGDMSTRSPEALVQLERLALLNQKELAGGLSEEERQEQERLRMRTPTAASVLPSPAVERLLK